MIRTIGIDLGTYNSAAAFACGKTATMIRSKAGSTVYGKNFPSFVLFDYTGKVQSVGKMAKANTFRDPKLLVWGVKRLVGLSYEIAKARGEFERFQYDVEPGPGGSILIKVGEKRYFPQDILGFILKEIKEDAENCKLNQIVGGKVDRVVISHPAYFDGTRVGPVIDAAEKAGFSDVCTIPEPTAAAISYSLKLQSKNRILTFDLGAGTLDVTIMLLLQEGGELQCGELCTSGEEALGGIDMDELLTGYVADKYGLEQVKSSYGLSGVFREEVERSKIELSTKKSSYIHIPNVLKKIELKRNELETSLTPFLEKCRGPIRTALNQARINASQLDHVLFVGGPTHMPCVRATVKDELKKLGASKQVLHEIDQLDKKPGPVDPMDCVAIGAALVGAGIVKPVVNDANGYGTILGPIQGLPDYYYSVIPPNSPYPISRSASIIHLNPDALRVPISLVKKLAYFEHGKTVYRYRLLGSFDCYIRSTGESPYIDITMELTKKKNLITTFIHRQTSESVKFVNVDELNGNVIELQETTLPPPREEGEEYISGAKTHNHAAPVVHRKWTENQLESARHVGQMVVFDFAENCQNLQVRNKKEELKILLAKARNPETDTHPIMSRISELLVLLKVAGVITEEELRIFSSKVREIENVR